MPELLARLRRPAPLLLALVFVLTLALLVGCGGDNKKNPMSPGAGSSSSFTGWFGNGSESGSMNITVSQGYLAGRLRANRAGSVVVSASGFLHHTGGATDTLAGTYNDENGYVDLHGGGYTLAGVYDSGPPSVVFGTYTGPNGNGHFDCQVGGSSSADIYGGTFENEAHTSDGSFIVVVRGSALEGAAIESGASNPTGFTGTVSGTGTTRAISVKSLITNGYRLFANGNLDTGTHTMGGLYKIWHYTAPTDSAPSDSGGWTGERVSP